VRATPFGSVSMANHSRNRCREMAFLTTPRSILSTP
jgi:hypothetical protein